MCNGLELEADPFPKSMWEAADVLADGSGWEGTIDGCLWISYGT